ncbi:glycosyltransferase family 2 protein [Treponema sp.]|uniref:glycosyltransferase family 2 protein n=1 Tax=Treponema sp. TaxID=166 RepID=UPI003F00A294
MKTLSIVVPCFNEEEAVFLFYEETKKILQKMKNGENEKSKIESFEFVFVDDGSSDKTLDALRQISNKDENVHYLSFSRNFGKEAALFAGLSKSDGEYVAVMDADLQDPPSLLPEMLFAIQNEGYDCAATRRVTRKNEPPVRSFFARRFYKIMGKLSNVPVVDGARDFRLMTKKFKDAVLSLSERNRFTKGIFPWVGFKTKWFDYENVERVAGKTKWSFWKLFLYSIDGIIGFSTKPLVFSAVVGVVSIFASLALILFIIIRRIIFGDPVQGWASLVCFITFFAGLQLTALGIVGLYISKIYTEVKQRPLYVIQEEK